MTNNAIKVNMRQFRRVHGHEPRGRYLWTFRYGGSRSYFSMRGEYEECLAEAIRRAEEKGVTELVVSSVVYGQDEAEDTRDDEEDELEEEARLEREREEERREEGHNWAD